MVKPVFRHLPEKLRHFAFPKIPFLYFTARVWVRVRVEVRVNGNRVRLNYVFGQTCFREIYYIRSNHISRDFLIRKISGSFSYIFEGTFSLSIFKTFYLLRYLCWHLVVKQNDKAKCEIALNFLDFVGPEAAEANWKTINYHFHNKVDTEIFYTTKLVVFALDFLQNWKSV